MQRIESTRKQQIALLCATLIAIALSFPMAMSGKVWGTLLWFGASVLALMMGITRLKVLARPTVVLTFLFATSFFIPIEVVLARGQAFQIRWMHCEVVSLQTSIEHTVAADETTHIIVRGCVPLLGVEPSRVVRIAIPER